MGLCYSCLLLLFDHLDCVVQVLCYSLSFWGALRPYDLKFIDFVYSLEYNLVYMRKHFVYNKFDY
jgi:hypothetical protein